MYYDTNSNTNSNIEISKHLSSFLDNLNGYLEKMGGCVFKGSPHTHFDIRNTMPMSYPEIQGKVYCNLHLEFEPDQWLQFFEQLQQQDRDKN